MASIGRRYIHPLLAPMMLSTLMLLWALYPDNPYGYYILLRWVCCAAFAYMTWAAANSRAPAMAWLFFVAAVVYNPVIRVHLTRELWTVINVLSALLLCPSRNAVRLAL